MIVAPAAAIQAADPGSELKISLYAPHEGSFPACTHMLLAGGMETVTAGDQLLFRQHADLPFAKSPLAGLSDAHSISVAFDAKKPLFYVCDTGNHRIVAFDSPAQDKIQTAVTRLAGVDLDRPHDVVVDDKDGWTYVLNPNRPTLFRFRKLGQDEAALDLPESLGYSRALSLVDGVIYVIASNAGAVVEIEDFAAGKYKIHRSHGKKKEAPAGSWRTTGLVFNDVDRFAGYWYATSYFCPTYAADTDCNQNKLIRFQNWRDLAIGEWEDLSSLLPPDIVPYYLTPGKDELFIAVFNHEPRGQHDKIYRLSRKSP